MITVSPNFLRWVILLEMSSRGRGGLYGTVIAISHCIYLLHLYSSFLPLSSMLKITQIMFVLPILSSEETSEVGLAETAWPDLTTMVTDYIGGHLGMVTNSFFKNMTFLIRMRFDPAVWFSSATLPIRWLRKKGSELYSECNSTVHWSSLALRWLVLLKDGRKTQAFSHPQGRSISWHVVRHSVEKQDKCNGIFHSKAREKEPELWISRKWLHLPKKWAFAQRQYKIFLKLHKLSCALQGTLCANFTTSQRGVTI